MGLVSVISTRRRPGLWAWCLLFQRVDVHVYGPGVCVISTRRRPGLWVWCLLFQRVDVQVYGSGVCYFNA